MKKDWWLKPLSWRAFQERNSYIHNCQSSSPQGMQARRASLCGRKKEVKLQALDNSKRKTSVTWSTLLHASSTLLWFKLQLDRFVPAERTPTFFGMGRRRNPVPERGGSTIWSVDRKWANALTIHEALLECPSHKAELKVAGSLSLQTLYALSGSANARFFPCRIHCSYTSQKVGEHSTVLLNCILQLPHFGSNCRKPVSSIHSHTC